MAELVRAELSWFRRNISTSSPLGQVKAQVNPTEITFEKGISHSDVAIPGLDAPVVQFVRGEAETLQVELFFDTTETGRPVTEKTDQVYGLVKIDPVTHAPPVCTFVWGAQFPGSQLGLQSEGGIVGQESQRRSEFQCVLTKVTQRFTLFSEEGTPLRAVLSVAMKEYRPVHEQIAELALQSNDHTRQHVVLAGQTLPGIAAEVFGDASEWRALADHNAIEDPLALEPGVILEIPPIL